MKKSLFSYFLILPFLFSLPTFGTDDEPIFPLPQGDIRFQFSPPGARSLGMGGTFIAIADDATAAESNPAGLTILREPEFSLHFRNTSEEVQEINFFSPVEEIDTFSSQTTDPSFLSYVHPTKKAPKPFRRASISIYYQQAAHFKGISGQATSVSVSEDFVVLSESARRLDLALEHIGFSGAARVGKYLSLGASIRVSRLTIDDFIAASFSNPNFTLQTDLETDSTQTEITYNAGIIFNPNGKFSAGAVFKKGTTFDLISLEEITLFCTEGFALLCDTTRNTLFMDLPINTEFETPRSIIVPDVLGAGVAYRPNDNWIFGVDLLQVMYSDINQGLTQPDDPFGFDDETEIHAGFEYGFEIGAKQSPAFIRAGYFIDPDHDADPLIDSDQKAVTLGGGILLNDRLQLDAAVARSTQTTTSILSFVLHL